MGFEPTECLRVRMQESGLSREPVLVSFSWKEAGEKLLLEKAEIRGVVGTTLAEYSYGEFDGIVAPLRAKQAIAMGPTLVWVLSEHRVEKNEK